MASDDLNVAKLAAMIDAANEYVDSLPNDEREAAASRIAGRAADRTLHPENYPPLPDIASL